MMEKVNPTPDDLFYWKLYEWLDGISFVESPEELAEAGEKIRVEIANNPNKVHSHLFREFNDFYNKFLPPERE